METRSTKSYLVDLPSRPDELGIGEKGERENLDSHIDQYVHGPWYEVERSFVQPDETFVNPRATFRNQALWTRQFGVENEKSF